LRNHDNAERSLDELGLWAEQLSEAAAFETAGGAHRDLRAVDNIGLPKIQVGHCVARGDVRDVHGLALDYVSVRSLGKGTSRRSTIGVVGGEYSSRSRS